MSSTEVRQPTLADRGWRHSTTPDNLNVYENKSLGLKTEPLGTLAEAFREARRMQQEYDERRPTPESAVDTSEAEADREAADITRPTHVMKLRAAVAGVFSGQEKSFRRDVVTNLGTSAIVTEEEHVEVCCAAGLTADELKREVARAYQLSGAAAADGELPYTGVLVACCLGPLAGEAKGFADDYSTAVFTYEEFAEHFTPTLCDTVVAVLGALTTEAELNDYLLEQGLGKLSLGEPDPRFSLFEAERVRLAVDEASKRLGLTDAPGEEEAAAEDEPAGAEGPRDEPEAHAASAPPTGGTLFGDAAPAAAPANFLKQEILISKIHVDPTIQSREGGTSDEKVEEYKEAYLRGDDMPPVRLFWDGERHWLSRGFHRVPAALRAGRTALDCEVFEGGRREALLDSLASNKRHGLSRSNADKRKAVTMALMDEEWGRWTDGRIAEHVGVTQPFVSGIRRELVSQNVLSDDGVRVGRDEREYHVRPTARPDAPEAAPLFGELGTAAESSPADAEGSARDGSPTPPAGDAATTPAGGRKLDELVLALRRAGVAGERADDLVARGFTHELIEEAKSAGLLERHVNQRCFYVWQAGDVAAAIRERGALNSLQLEDLGCQPHALEAALKAGAVVKEGAFYDLPSGGAGAREVAEAVASAATTAAPAAGAQTAAAAPAQRPAPREDKPARPAIEDLLKGRKMILSIAWFPAFKGQVNVSVNVGDQPEQADRRLLDVSDVRPLPEPVMQMIAERILAEDRRGAAKAATPPAKRPPTGASKGAPTKKTPASKKDAPAGAAKKGAPAAKSSKKAAKKSPAVKSGAAGKGRAKA